MNDLDTTNVNADHDGVGGSGGDSSSGNGSDIGSGSGGTGDNGSDLNDGRAYYITTAIPYVNGPPHLGHAMEYVLADAHARYHRLRGRDVRYQAGSDENGLKNVQAAEEEGISTAELVARNAAGFEGLRDMLDLTFDDFIRTSIAPHHRAGAERLWSACDAAGDLYRKTYSGLYCIGCEQFYAPSELVDGRCPEHGTVPEEIEEENWFFRLSKYGDALLELIESGRMRIEPASRRNEVVAFIRRGLEDFSASRSVERARGWGIPVPGDPSQVMYVWFDALSNYITALHWADDGADYTRYWSGSPDRVHVIGKGITRFHAVYWPAMLMSAGLPTPTAIYVHGYVTAEGRKIGKSLGNAIDPRGLTERYGAEPVRFYLLRHVHAFEDGDVSEERLIRAFNADLASQLGNLLKRTTSMIERYCDGLIPAPAEAGELDAAMIGLATNMPARFEEAMARYATHEALDAAWEVLAAANKYVVEVEPWALFKRLEDDRAVEAKLNTCLYTLAEAIRLVAYVASVAIPEASARTFENLGLTLETAGSWDDQARWGALRPGTVVAPGDALFPRLDVETGEGAGGG